MFWALCVLNFSLRISSCSKNGYNMCMILYSFWTIVAVFYQQNFSGFLSTLSCQSSTLLLTLITWDRLVSVTRPLQLRSSSKSRYITFSSIYVYIMCKMHLALIEKIKQGCISTDSTLGCVCGNGSIAVYSYRLLRQTFLWQ